MRTLLMLCCCWLSLATATSTLQSDRVTVLFDDIALEPYAQELVDKAEAALDVLLPLFAVEAENITIQVTDSTDVYNGYATLLPRPKLTLRALYPVDVNLGYSDDDLYVLLVHEIVHLLQLSYTATPDVDPQDSGFNLGLVGSGAAAVPPTWVIEGLATWLESEFSLGGRRDNAFSQGLFYSAALSDSWPDFRDIGLVSYGSWPGGFARYHYGAGFLDHLIAHYGFEAVLASLRQYNAGGLLADYSEAWRIANNVVLEEEWLIWRDTVKAVAEASNTQEDQLVSDTGWFTGAPALSPAGNQLAWVSWPAEIVLADINNDELANQRSLIDHRFVTHLRWWDEERLIYARPVRRFNSTWNELFSLNVRTGQEKQLSEEARAFFPNPLPDGCILYARDAGETASLQRWCEGERETYWQAEAGQHILGLDVSPAGQIALSLWEDGRVTLALLLAGQLEYLSQSCDPQLNPHWLDEDTLLFEMHQGIVDLYALKLSSQQGFQLTSSPAGAFAPSAGEDDLWYRALGGSGYNIARQSATLPKESEPVPLQASDCTPSLSTIAPQDAQGSNYNPLPSLLPSGWLPGELGFSFSSLLPHVSIDTIGQDDSAKHRYTLRSGIDFNRSGLLGGSYSYLDYQFAPILANNPDPVAEPLSFGVQLGAFPNPAPDVISEIILGARASLLARVPFDRWSTLTHLEAGAIYLPSADQWQPEASAQLSLSNMRSDIWNYSIQGLQVDAIVRLYATSTGNTAALWGVANYQYPLADLNLLGTLAMKLEAGYNPVLAFPIAPQELGGALSLGYRYSLPLALRLGDGKYALERITLEPRVRSYYDDGFSLAGDLGLGFDGILSYNAPLSVQLSGGYAERFWVDLGFRF